MPTEPQLTDLFESEPRTRDEFIREIYRKQNALFDKVEKEVIPRLDRTNGRVGKLEKFMWAVGGGLVILSSFFVPQYLEIVRSAATAWLP